MKTYLEFAFAGAAEPSSDGLEDARQLAMRCCEQLSALGDDDRFKPQLLVLLATPAFLADGRAHEMVPGIREVFCMHYGRVVPLIGSSAAAVFYPAKADDPAKDHSYRINDKGAVLIAIASKFLEAKVGVSDIEETKIASAVSTLLGRLDLDPKNGLSNPRTSQKLMTFLPNLATTVPSEIANELFEGLAHRMPVTGGVSYAFGHEGSSVSYQFTESGVYTGAIVAAKLSFKVPVGSGLGWSLDSTHQEVPVGSASSDLNEAAASSILAHHPYRVLGTENRSHYTHYTPHLVLERRGTAQKIHQQRLRTGPLAQLLQVLWVDIGKLTESLVRTVAEPAARIGLKNPAGALAFHCTSFFIRLGKPDSLVSILQAMEQALQGAPVVGGYFDGEIGVNHVGESVLEHWAGSALTFGDELRARAAIELSYRAIADNVPKLKESQTVADAVRAALEMVHNAGYPGAMISLKVRNFTLNRGEVDKWMKPQLAVGRAKPDLGPEQLNDKMDSKPHFRKTSEGKGGGTKCQYAFPLYSTGGPNDLLGMLEIDLGDKSDQESRPWAEDLLKLLGAAVESALVLVIGKEEAKVNGILDEAEERALACSSVQEARQILLDAAVVAFGASSAYLRIPDTSGNHLILVAGRGPYVDIAFKARRKIDATDQSPTAQAFIRKRGIVLNHAEADDEYKKLHQRTARAREVRNPDLKHATDALTGAVKNVKSLVTAPLAGPEGWPSGVVTLLNTHAAWAVHPHHERCIKGLAKRLHFVEQQIQRKIAADILQNLAKNINFSDFARGFTRLAANFRDIWKANTVSLFLKDPSADRFILKAQSGWQEKGWEQRAYFNERDGFTGSVVLQTLPKYRSDLAEYITATGKNLCYQRAMFGTEHANGDQDKMRTEIWGLPLWRDNQCIGIITACRRNNPTDEDRSHAILVNAENDILVPAAGLLSTYVGILMDEEAKELQKKIEMRQDSIRAAVRDSGPEFGDALCEAVCRAMNAVEVTFWLPQNDGLELTSSCFLSNRGEKEERESPDRDDPTVKRVWKMRDDPAAKFERVEPTQSNRGDREEAAKCGALKRASIALPLGVGLRGVLDIKWPENMLRIDQGIENSELLALGDIVADEYRESILIPAHRAEDEERDHKLQILEKQVAAMRNAVEESRHQLGKVGSAVGGVEAYINEGHAAKALSTLDTFRRINLTEAEHSLKTVVQPQDSQPPQTRLTQVVGYAEEKLKQEKIRYKKDIDDHLMVAANEDSLHRAFVNIVENAVIWIKKRQECYSLPHAFKGVLIVSARSRDRTVEIRFCDNGLGMTEAQRDTVLAGKAEGKGIRVAKQYIEDQGGTLAISSEVGQGTCVTIELPLGGKE